MQKVLTLPISEPWFSMILSGVKREEYRKLSQYYLTRFKNYSYNSISPAFTATCSIGIGYGKQEWGAVLDVQYFILTIESIDEKFNIRS